MNQSFEKTTLKPLKQSQSHQKYCSLMEEGSATSIQDIKSKIDKFKRIKQQSRPEEILDFDVSREALKKYQPGASSNESKVLSPEPSTIMSLGKSKSKPVLMQQPSSKPSSLESPFLNINIRNIFKSTSGNAKERPSTALLTTPSSSTGAKQYIQLNPYVKDKSRGSGSDNLSLNQQSTALDDKNRIKTQINLFVKQLNYTTTPSRSVASSDGCIAEKASAFNSNASKGNNLIINGLDSFQLSDSNRGKSYQKVMDSMSSSVMIKMDEVKSLKATLYNMTNEDLAKLPQDYIDELKDLACLINTVF